jgi:hypothetical protein
MVHSSANSNVIIQYGGNVIVNVLQQTYFRDGTTVSRLIILLLIRGLSMRSLYFISSWMSSEDIKKAETFFGNPGHRPFE